MRKIGCCDIVLALFCFVIVGFAIFMAIDITYGSIQSQARKISTLNPGASEGLSGGSQIMLFSLVIVLVCATIFFLSWFLTVRRCPECKCRKMRRIKKERIYKATDKHDGIVESTYRCNRCGCEWKERTHYTDNPRPFRSEEIIGR